MSGGAFHFSSSEFFDDEPEGTPVPSHVVATIVDEPYVGWIDGSAAMHWPVALLISRYDEEYDPCCPVASHNWSAVGVEPQGVMVM